MSGERLTKCPCGRTVGVKLDPANFEMKHQGRKAKFTGQGSVTITCECGRSTATMLEGPSGVGV